MAAPLVAAQEGQGRLADSGNRDFSLTIDLHVPQFLASRGVA